eukprot:scaffold34881_cov41-Prasinocladus_malaysianus.AAC.1
MDEPVGLGSTAAAERLLTPSDLTYNFECPRDKKRMECNLLIATGMISSANNEALGPPETKFALGAAYARNRSWIHF